MLGNSTGKREKKKQEDCVKGCFDQGHQLKYFLKFNITEALKYERLGIVWLLKTVSSGTINDFLNHSLHLQIREIEDVEQLPFIFYCLLNGQVAGLEKQSVQINISKIVSIK